MEELTHIHNILDQVRSAGAQADLIVTHTRALNLKALNANLDEHKVTESRVFGLRTLLNGQVGLAYSESEEADALSFMVKQALDNGQFSSAKPEQQLNPSRETLKVEDAFLCPQEDCAVVDKIEALLNAEQLLLSKETIASVPYNGFSDTVSTKSIYTTQGLSGTQAQRTCGVYFYPLAKRGEKSAMALGMCSARKFSDLDFSAAVEGAYWEASGLLDGEPIKTGSYDVLFSREKLEQLLGAFSLCWSGKSAQDGLNPWRDQVGHTVASEKLTIKDIPIDTQGFGFSAFDDEGIACQDTTFIEKGQLITLAHNTATANYFNTQSTGHGARSAKTSLGVSPHQLEICPGIDSDDVLYANKYFEITGLEGVHSGTNAISGDFSLGASGYLVQDGQRIKPVRGVTVAGNFYQLLQDITAIGKRSEWTSGFSAKLPPVRFHSVSVSGA